MIDFEAGCIYYNKKDDYYYLVISVSDMVYGRRGYKPNPTLLEAKLQTESKENGIEFKINDDIIINSDNIYNIGLPIYKYYSEYDEYQLKCFEFVMKLDDDKFDIVKIFAYSNLLFKPSFTIDLNNKFKVKELTDLIIEKDDEIEKLTTAKKNLTIRLYRELVK